MYMIKFNVYVSGMHTYIVFFHFKLHSARRAPMSGNRKHSKNNLKIYVIIFAKYVYVVDLWTILFSYIIFS